MDEKNIPKGEKINRVNLLQIIKSRYILSLIFNNLKKKKFLEIIKINKNIQKQFNLNIKDYKEFSEIIIEIIPTKKDSGSFIHFDNKNDESFAQIYFNDNENEIKRSYIQSNEKSKIGKIKIHINRSIKSLYKLLL